MGWQVRFQKTQDRTRIKVMTDGILLAETQDDPDLDRYDTLIIDEAHSARSTSTSCWATSGV